jgi:hypothetical protein
MLPKQKTTSEKGTEIKWTYYVPFHIMNFPASPPEKFGKVCLFRFGFI